MSADSPWALPVSVDHDVPSVNLAPPTDGSGAVVALVADEGPRTHGWASRVAVSLAREWAGDGLKVFLADGDLDRPALHRILERENGEGVADAVVYGASPGRIGRPVPEGGFLFASAGTVVANLEEAWSHPRWAVLLDAFRESGSLLLLFLPAGEGDGLNALVGQADRVIWLADEAPAEDPRTGYLYIHPAEGSLSGVAEETFPSEPASTHDSGPELSPPGPAQIEAETGEEEAGLDAFGDLDFEDEPEPEAREEPDVGGLSFEHEVADDEEPVVGDFALSDEQPADPLPQSDEARAPAGDFTLPTETEGGGEAEESVIGDFSFPDEDEDEAPAAGFELPEEPATVEDDLLDSELVVGDDFPSADNSLVPDEELWTGTGELQVTDEWAGEGPSALGEVGGAAEPGTADEEEGAVQAAPSSSGGDADAGGGGHPTTMEGLEGSVPPPAAAAPMVAAGERASQEPGPTPVARPEPARRAPVRARPVERKTPWLLIILLVVVVIVVLANHFGYVTIPGLSFVPVLEGPGMAEVGPTPSSPTG
jgi:hypothetical protein